MKTLRHLAFALITALGVSLVLNCADVAEPEPETQVEPMSDAEVTAELDAVATLAKTGAGESVFENPDTKCQHCHYDIHETWQNSMHGKSWSDPIFQTKYQAFLKTMIGKLTGANNATIEGKLKVCGNCHAPAAIYSQDFSVTLTQASGTDANTVAGGGTDITQPVTVAGVGSDGTTPYTIEYQVQNATNQAGISCAYCHSVETIHMREAGDTYTKIDATLLTYSSSNTADMNSYFSLVGPLIFSDYEARTGTQTKDGRYTMKAIPLDAGLGTVYAGGPYYGPYGVAGLEVSHTNDTVDRQALFNASGFYPTSSVNNPTTPENDQHFEDRNKELCLSCHQRSSGTADANGAGELVELCTTWIITEDKNFGTASSPKCTKCHMEKRDGIVLNHWKRPTLPDTTSTVSAGMDNLLTIGAYNTHAFEGGTSTTKLEAGISGTLSVNNNVATVTLDNKTAHAFPGAHPMRRAAVIVRAFDQAGSEIAVTDATGNTTWGDVTYTYATDGTYGGSITINITDSGTQPGRGANPTFLGQVPHLNGSGVFPQTFGDADVANPTGMTKKISEVPYGSGYNTGFVRLYGRETIHTTGVTNPNTAPNGTVPGDAVDGFLGNSSADNRLISNESETFTITFASTPATVEYRIYYMQKGPKFPDNDADGWPDENNSNNKNGVRLVHTYTSP